MATMLGGLTKKYESLLYEKIQRWVFWMEKKLNRFFIYRSVQIPISMKIILFQISCILV